jgi:hypothetical protein
MAIKSKTGLFKMNPFKNPAENRGMMQNCVSVCACGNCHICNVPTCNCACNCAGHMCACACGCACI